MKKQILVDLVGISGLGLISYGSWLIYQPAAYLVSGVAFLAWAVRADVGAGDDI